MITSRFLRPSSLLKATNRTLRTPSTYPPGVLNRSTPRSFRIPVLSDFIERQGARYEEDLASLEHTALKEFGQNIYQLRTLTEFQSFLDGGVINPTAKTSNTNLPQTTTTSGSGTGVAILYVTHKDSPLACDRIFRDDIVKLRRSTRLPVGVLYMGSLTPAVRPTAANTEGSASSLNLANADGTADAALTATMVDRYGVDCVPTVLLLVRGTAVWRVCGGGSPELLEQMRIMTRKYQRIHGSTRMANAREGNEPLLGTRSF